MYKNREAIAMAGKTRPTNGTKIDGKYAAAIIETPFFSLLSSSIIPQRKRKKVFSNSSSSPRWGKAFLHQLYPFEKSSWARRESNPRLRASEARALIHWATDPRWRRCHSAGRGEVDPRNRSRFIKLITRDVDHSFLTNWRLRYN